MVAPRGVLRAAFGSAARCAWLRRGPRPARALSTAAQHTPYERMRNIGISAHIDSGKTTLTERILFFTGRIGAIHEVRGKDGVGAKMDFMELEREKGITIQSAATHCSWDGHAINIIDTPGHVDFTIEVERALRVLDGAILVLCSVAGVQSQSITVSRQMGRYNVPRIAFVNKCDRAGASPTKVIAGLRDKLKYNAAALQLPIGLEEHHRGVVDLLTREAIIFEGEHGETVTRGPVPPDLASATEAARAELVERVAEVDEALAELFLLGEPISANDLRAAIRRATLALTFVPVMMGSAYKNKGVHALLDGVIDYLPNPAEVKNVALDLEQGEAQIPLTCDPTLPLCGLAFKLEEGKYGQLTYLRIYQGTVRRGDTLFNVSDGKKVKVPRLVQMHANEMSDVPEGRAGDIVAMFGVECRSGTTFTDGKTKLSLSSMYVPEPVISLALKTKNREASANFSKALVRFVKEDPTFRVSTNEETSETIIAGMGELHLEIYVERMRREYNVDCEVGQPAVAFRETLRAKAPFDYLHKKQSGGSGQYGRVVGYVEPLEEGSKETFAFDNHMIGNNIPPEFLPAVEKGFVEALAKGALTGHPVTGVRVVLTDGAAHAVDSNELAFRLAAQGAFKQSFIAGKPTVLEPVMKVEVEAPVEYQGTIVGQLNQRKGSVANVDTREASVVIEAEVPLDNMFGYSTDLRSVTQGKGEFSMEYAKHAPTPKEKQDAMIAEHQKLAGKKK